MVFLNIDIHDDCYNDNSSYNITYVTAEVSVVMFTNMLMLFVCIIWL